MSMTIPTLINRFAHYAASDYLKFDRVDTSPTRRMDLCAFMLLDALVPSSHDIILSATHDTIYLDVDLAALSAVASEADILTLVRCGVSYDNVSNCLWMYA